MMEGRLLHKTFTWASKVHCIHGLHKLLTFSFFFVYSAHRLYYFAIQYYGECFGAPEGTKYDKFGRASNCWSGVGGANSNFVYTLY